MHAALLDLPVAPMCLLDLEGRVVRVGRGWERCLGWRAEGWVDTPLPGCGREGDAARARKALGTCREEGRAELELHGRGDDGRHRRLRCALTLDGDGIWLHATEGASAEALQRSAMVEHAVDAYLLHDMEGRILDVNERLCDELGYSREELLAMSVHDIERTVRPGTSFDGIWRRVGVLQPITVEGRHRRRDGTEFPVEVRLVLNETGGQRYAIALCSDLTERKRAEARQAQLTEELRDASGAKSAFLANMSHELRTPLNAIIGYTELLDEEARDLEQPHLVDDLGKVRAAAGHLLALVNDVLDLSKIEAGRMELEIEDLDVCELVDDVASTVEPLVHDGGNRLVVRCEHDLPLLHADRTRLRQVLVNLLANAARFTREGEITLRVERGPDGWALSVRDTGVGIEPDRLERLFEPFVQAQGTKGGTGLGLTISRELCRRMGGDLVATSTPGEGSTFVARLPLRPAGAASAGPG